MDENGKTPSFTLENAAAELKSFTKEFEELNDTQTLNDKAKEIVERVNTFDKWTPDVSEPQYDNYGDSYDGRLPNVTDSDWYWYDGECCCSRETVESWRDAENDPNGDLDNLVDFLVYANAAQILEQLEQNHHAQS
ncbi:hypothetical protein [Vibrio owensii]|uniref:hypothetical protein n=1 Tax=Vibrio owensii TaxID=696485 RepID=UPI0018F1100D|nr:hypothetical protein [Vibrio owensii]